MSCPIHKFDASENPSQDNFLDTLFNEIVPMSLEEPQIVCLSGAMGSGKSVAVMYAINLLSSDYPGLQTYVGRISVESVKKTFFKELKEMTPESMLSVNNNENIVYKNGSSVDICGWGGGDTSALRSLNLNIAVIEEVTQDAIKAGYFELNKRALIEIIGRIRGTGRPNIIFLISNPDSPTHWMHEEYIEQSMYVNGVKQTKPDLKDNVHTFYSITTDNKKFLSKGYIKNMQRNMTAKMQERMIQGLWVDIAGEGIYDMYDEEIHYKNHDYKVNPNAPVYLSWDFNTAKGKAMSACMCQFLNDHFHYFDELVLEDSNTRGMLEELERRGFFRFFTKTQLLIDGDGTGWSKDSSATFNNYDLMRDFLTKLPYKVNFKIVAPRSNPEIINRHNKANAYMLNYDKEVRVSVYRPCKILNKGFKSSKMKGTKEDDANIYQHITTAATYLIWNRTKRKGGVKVVKNYRG